MMMLTVDSTAMTDSVITDACPPADTSHVPTPPSYNSTQPHGEFDRDSLANSVATTDNDTTATAVKTNGISAHHDDEDPVVENSKLPSTAVSHGNVNGPKTVVADTDCTKLSSSSSDLRTNGCDGPNLGSSATAPLLTNGHVNM